jgi:putative transposase
MDDYESLSDTKWECKYHVVFIPKCRRKTLYTELRRHLGMCSESWPSRRKAG